MKQLLTGLGLGLALIATYFFLASSNGGTPERRDRLIDEVNETAEMATGLPQRVVPIDLSGPFSFAGEEIPVSNFDVRERLDQELMRNAYFHRNTLSMLKRRGRYFPTIERILREEGVPEDLKYLAVAESGLTNAVSPAGAKGVWQFMAPTAKGFGLEVNGEVDERYHLEKATRAACAYLKAYYAEFGDWRWVAAAYNMGGPNVRKWRARQQATDIFELDINKETMAYVFRIVAIKTILEQPEEFGYFLDAEDAYEELDDYTVDTVTRSIPDLADYAKQKGTNYRMLKVFNPWLISGSLTVSKGNSYAIRIPQ